MSNQIDTNMTGKSVFAIDGLTIEIGGKDKNISQVWYFGIVMPLVSDDIDTGGGNKVPIWLFGFLY